MNKYTIKIRFCNNIETADVTIFERALNIKYGPNGLGKSTIASAIVASVANDGSLQKLKPFKYRSVADQHDPVVLGTENIGSVAVFNDAYVSQFVFQRDEVLKNSFDIFVKTDKYKAAMQEINVLLEDIKSAFDGNEALSSIVSDLKELRDAFGVTNSGVLSKSSKGYKAFGSGNKIENIPPRLMPFVAFIKSEQPASWIAWQAKGNTFLDLSDNCPYCASDLKEPEKKDTARQVAKEYDSKTIEHLNALQAIINRLGKYFEQSCRERLEKITKSKIELSQEETNFLSNLHGDVKTLMIKLEGLRSISFFALRDVDKIEDEIAKLKIDLDLLEKLKSEDTKAVVDPINEKLQELINRVGDLKGKINIHKSQIAKSIAENEKSINGFLKSAGYKYSVVIKPEADSYKMKLIHQDFNEHLESAVQHLSYGERNAFALVLFMHQVLNEKPDLAVLDDPVSSFDKTKKFAILNELFRGKGTLRNTTVLMLTHDIEPVIDVMRSVKRLFQDTKSAVCFLTSKDSVITETVIDKNHIKTFAQICEENIQSLSDDVIKCIYLRRHFEIVNDYGKEYNLLASLLHAKSKPTIKISGEEYDMSNEDINCVTEEIKRSIPNFDYYNVLSIIKNKEEMRCRFNVANVGYDKIQLFRIYKHAHMSDVNDVDAIFQKFVNESFHIENEYLMQLNPRDFDNVPEHIVSECNRLVSGS